MPDAVIDLRYATANNFVGAPLYPAGARCLIHESLAPGLAKAADVPEQAVNVSSVIDAFKDAGNRMNILVLDACRDNPFASTASGKGLAQVG